MQNNNLDRLQVIRLTGQEHLYRDGAELPFDVLGFWQWAFSDVAGNALRGVLAEYLVACALGVESGTRTEWDAYDIRTRQGVKVEVKSAAYLQSWRQTKLSTITFGIQPAFGWDAKTGESGTERKRNADVYVFALLKHQDKATLNPLDIDQWDFYVLPAAILDERVPTQKRISLGILLSLPHTKAEFEELREVIEGLFLGGSPASSEGRG
jgi:hypothetical protein